MEHLPTVVKLDPRGSMKLALEFDDGLRSVADLSGVLPTDSSLTRPLFEPEYFQLVEIYPGGDGIYWPNGFDLGADMLYELQYKTQGVAKVA